MASESDSRRVGPFVLEAEIGVGGMGVVWRARSNDGTPAAIKLVRGPLDSDLLRRFEREAKIRLDHPNVIRVLDAGVGAGSAWIAMELLEGESLEQILARGRLRAEEVVDFGVQAARGIGAAHSQGIVHRDIKPSNLFRCQDGTVKVLDFGVALLAAAMNDTRFTRTGGVVGTPAYMSPEQIVGGSGLDARTDIWSLGAALYEALSGRRPFGAQSPIALMVAIVQEEPVPLRALCPGAPPGLLAIIERALVKKRDGRWSGIDELGAALERVDLRQTMSNQDWDVATMAAASVGTDELLPPGEQRLVAVVLAEGVREPALVQSAIRGHGGRVLPLLGRSIIGLFGAEAWEGDEVRRAVSAALAARAGAEHVGVASGRATARGSSIAGGVVQAAEAACTAGLTGVAVDVHTARALAGAFDVREASGLLEVMGETTRVMGRSGMGDAAPLCGREAEVAQIRAGVRAAMDESRAQVVLVSGPPGIGKSRLRRETERQLAKVAPEARLVIGRAEPLRQHTAWALLANALRARASTKVPAEASALSMEAFADATAARECAAFLGELMGSGTLETPALAAARLDPQLMSDRLRLSVIDYFTGLAEGGPLALLLEDLQWADEASVLALEELLDRLAERPFFVLATARPELAELHPQLFAGRDVRRVELRGLLSGDVAEMAAAIADRPLADSLVRWIAERSGGNPLFVEQLVLELVDRGLLDEHPQELPVPLSVEAAVQSRLDHLPVAEKDACKRSAIYKRAFSHEEAGAVGVAQPASLLASLARRDLLTSRSRGRGGAREYQFKSSLVAEVAYGLLADEMRAQLHLAAAAWLDVQPDRDEEEVASHYQLGGDTERACQRFAEAALVAARRGDNRRVLVCSDRAFATNAPKALPRATRFSLRMARAEAMRFLGMRAEQEGEISDALAAAESDGERARALSEKLAFASRIGRRQEALAIGEQAVAAARAARSGEVLAVALGKQAATLAYAGRLEAARAAVAEAAPLAERAGALTAAFIADVRAQVAAAEGDLSTRRAAFEEAARRYAEIGDVRRAAGAEMNMADTLSRFGAYREAEAALKNALEHCRRVGNRVIEGYALLNLGYALSAQGRTAEALSVIGDAAQLAASMREPRLAVTARVYEARALAAQGEAITSKAMAAADEAEQMGLPSWRAVALAMAARAELLAGRTEAALDLSGRALALRDELGGVEEDEAEVFLVRADALDAAARPVEAELTRERGRNRLVEIAARIADAGWRQRFFDDVPGHRRLCGGGQT